MRKMPDHFEDAGESYSNFDNEEPVGMDEKLRGGPFFCCHPAWGHHGTMWFEDGRFHEEVWRYHTHVDTVTAETLRDLFDAVNEKWGSE